MNVKLRTYMSIRCLYMLKNSLLTVGSLATPADQNAGMFVIVLCLS